MQGNVVSFNKGFLEASGYAEHEIMGKPHSMLRHPDMPKEAFKDLWDTISDGRPWFGLVKNKRKNGDFYWVAANASPIYTDGKITGYVSVRYPASAEQKGIGERLYAKLRNKQVKMPWTVKPKFDRLTLVGISLGLLSIFMPYITHQEIIEEIASLVGVIGLGIVVWRSYLLSRPNAEQKKAIQNLANGQFRSSISGDDAWTSELNFLRTRIGQNASDAFDAARESAMLTTAMNAASTNLMVADAEFNIISINASLADMFERNETQLKTELTQFNAKTIVGSNMDVFYKNPAQQRAMVAHLSSVWNRHLQLAGLSLDLTVVPVITNGHKQGYVVEWQDMTAQRLVEQQLAKAIAEAGQGILSNRIDVRSQEGFYLMVGEGINSLLDGLHQFMSKTTFNIGEMAFNRLNGSLDGNYRGSYEMTQNAINTALRGLNETVGQVQFTSNIVNNSMGELAAAVQDFSGQIQTQAAAIEQTSAATHNMLTSSLSDY